MNSYFYNEEHLLRMFLEIEPDFKEGGLCYAAIVKEPDGQILGVGCFKHNPERPSWYYTIEEILFGYLTKNWD